MKKLFVAIMLCLPLLGQAQNSWEMPEADATGAVVNPDQKYLVGAVPVVDGKVVFSTTLKAPGKTASQIYDILLAQMKKMAKEEGQTEQSAVTLADDTKHDIYAKYQETLYFKRSALVSDFTKFSYSIIANCRDGEADVKLTRIYYIYDEERMRQDLKAEDTITDEYGLKKNKQKLSRVYGKFRRKTIDRKDYIFGKFAKLLQ